MSQLDHFDRIAPRYDELRSPPELEPVHALLVREGGLEGADVLVGEDEYHAGLERAERELPARVEYTLQLLVVRAER